MDLKGWRVETQGFIDVNTHPRAESLSRDLISRWEDLRDEGQALAIAGVFSEWPESINGGGWSVFGIKWQGKATAASIVHPLIGDDFVVSAAYSLMYPGTEIHPHVGYTGRVLRMHLGLTVPDEGDCALIVGGERREWRPGEVLLFDDTVLHSAHNRSKSPRLVLLLDVLRKSSHEGRTDHRHTPRGPE